MATMITTLKLALRPSLYIRSRLFSTNTGFCRTSDIMGRKRVRVACLSFFRAPAACFRIWSPPVRSKPTANSINAAQKTEFLGNGREDDFSTDTDHSAKAGEVIGNKIMIVVDSSLEAKGALEWALSHTVQSQDTVILVHVSNLSKQGSNGKGNLKAYELLYSQKDLCETRRPGVQVEIALLEGREKAGPMIVEEAKRQRVSLLVVGQRKQPSNRLWCLIRKRLAGKRNRDGVVEHCIQNASCMTIAVRRKSKKLGGYLITTKRHKNFWLLA
ncbi:hypothetical protein CJ030_MR4G015423 [Morella rubra]|uniref:UspA domain-containing protein n=1 Tax=Morella rubra TaxID=262757 RepID=A0A6A1VV49_9ROSI|nr:hypothetical protein CJ030_MR4G015423 [Morella rubra]